MTREVKTYYQYNSGFFEGSFRPITDDSPQLQGGELIVASVINEKLASRKQVIVLGIGEMLAASLIAIGVNFKSATESGKLMLVATNKEKTGPARLLAEAAKRLNMFGSEDGWWETLRNAAGDKILHPKIEWQKPLLPDTATLRFVEAHYDCVNYLSGVDTADLNTSLKKNGIGKVDLVHEHFGGLFRHKKPGSALKSISEALKPDGLLITMETLEDDPGKYGQIFDRIGLKPEKKHRWGDPGYRKYRKV